LLGKKLEKKILEKGVLRKQGKGLKWPGGGGKVGGGGGGGLFFVFLLCSISARAISPGEKQRPRGLETKNICKQWVG